MQKKSFKGVTGVVSAMGNELMTSLPGFLRHFGGSECKKNGDCGGSACE